MGPETIEEKIEVEVCKQKDGQEGLSEYEYVWSINIGNKGILELKWIAPLIFLPGIDYSAYKTKSGFIEPFSIERDEVVIPKTRFNTGCNLSEASEFNVLLTKLLTDRSIDFESVRLQPKTFVEQVPSEEHKVPKRS